MRRLVLTLVAGAFGSLLVLPFAHAQDWEDMSNDANSIRQNQRDLNHDRWELHEDLERGDLGAAAREAQEMQQRRENQEETQRDLNRDWNRSYNNGYGYGYGDRDYGYRGGYRHYNEDDND